jgi:hypothetical protein
VAACVTLKQGTHLDEEALIQCCRRSTADYKIPRHVAFSETKLRGKRFRQGAEAALQEHFLGRRRAISLSDRQHFRAQFQVRFFLGSPLRSLYTL